MRRFARVDDMRTWWPRALRPISKVIELAILSSREATKELRNLKTLIEQKASST